MKQASLSCPASPFSSGRFQSSDSVRVAPLFLTTPAWTLALQLHRRASVAGWSLSKHVPAAFLPGLPTRAKGTASMRCPSHTSGQPFHCTLHPWWAPRGRRSNLWALHLSTGWAPTPRGLKAEFGWGCPCAHIGQAGVPVCATRTHLCQSGHMYSSIT